jgi:hypothetical protein
VSEETEVSTGAAKTVLSYKELKKRKKPMIRRVPIALDGEKADEFNEKVAALSDAEDRLKQSPRERELLSEVATLRNEVSDLRDEMGDLVVEFVFRSVGRRKYEDLVDSCPPSKKQLAEAQKDGTDAPGWNQESFPPTLIAAALVEPELSEEEVFEIWESDDWNQAELVTLFMAAMAVNAERKVVDLGKESGLIDS